ncbi:MAG: dipeptidase [Gammaproteobacteria bacterium]|nr:dipeptidase [Gammaproteobacteria bacterium]
MSFVVTKSSFLPFIARSVALSSLLLFAGCQQQEETVTQEEVKTAEQPSAEALAKKYIIADTHIDVPYRLADHYEDVSQATVKGDFDYPRAVAGGLNAAFMSIYIPAEKDQEGGAKDLANELIDGVEAIVKNAPEKFALAYSTTDVFKNFEQGLISLPMGMENGSGLEADLENLKHFYNRGIRYITLAHSKTNAISDSSYDENRPAKGLTDFGKQLVTEMNNMGIMVDVSHITDEAFYQVVEITKVPVIASHSSARHFTPGFERNMNDEMIVALAKNGGVIQINYGSSFITKEALEYGKVFNKTREAFMEENKVEEDSEEVKTFTESYRQQNPYPYSTLDDVLDHFDHVVKLVGIDYVGLGSDYDGVGDSLPIGLKDVASYPNLIAGLQKRGYSEEDIAKILGGNLIRVWQQVEDYAANH